MSACSSALRFLSRTRVPAASKTLTPFLYQTVTIQQWGPLACPIGRRNASSKYTKDYDDVPFEDVEAALPPSIEDREPAPRTTITGPERKAFQKLYRRFDTRAPPNPDRLLQPEIDQIADEWYEEDEDQDGEQDVSLDILFDRVMTAKPAPGSARRRKPSENLATLAASILKPETKDIGKKPKKGTTVDKEEKMARRTKERTRVLQLMGRAQTDRELWEILDREVLGVIRNLDLDGVKKTIEKQVTALSEKEESEATSSPPFPTSPTDIAFQPHKTPTSDSRDLFANYPAHLYNAAHMLRTNFPSSALPLAILPTIKSVGRSSFALGASTQLYNLLIRTAWFQHASYDYVDELLHDMDNAGVEFDMETLQLLQSICSEYKGVRRGEMGSVVQAVWGMEYFSDGARRLRRWLDVVRLRLGVISETRTKEGKVVRGLRTRGGGDGMENRSLPVSQEVTMRTPQEEGKAREEVGGIPGPLAGGDGPTFYVPLDTSLLSEDGDATNKLTQGSQRHEEDQDRRL